MNVDMENPKHMTELELYQYFRDEAGLKPLDASVLANQQYLKNKEVEK